MNIGHVLFSPNGRIGQQDYWIGVLIIILCNLFLTWIPLLGFLIGLGLIWVGVAVYGKRLHDAGRTAWIHAIPWAVSLVLLVVSFMIFGGAIISAVMAGDAGDDAGAAAAAIGGGLGFVAVQSIGFLVWIGYTIWVGLLTGEPGENRFGPVPGTQIPTPAAPSSNPPTSNPPSSNPPSLPPSSGEPPAS